MSPSWPVVPPLWAPPLLIGAMFGALVAARFETALGCVGLALGTAYAAGARWPGRRWLLALAGGALVAVMLNLYLTPGRRLAALSFSGIEATFEGLGFGILLGLRMIGATAALQGLRAAWPGERAPDEMARMLSPLRRWGVPVGETRMMVGLATRFMPLLVEESGRISRLQELRAGSPARGLHQRLARLRAATIPTLVAAVERAERTAWALEARHYRVRETTPDTPRQRGAWMAAAAVALLALLWR